MTTRSESRENDARPATAGLRFVYSGPAAGTPGATSRAERALILTILNGLVFARASGAEADVEPILQLTEKLTRGRVSSRLPSGTRAGSPGT
jgi:hypothetical protein